MSQSKLLIVVLVTLVVGFVAGFALRPALDPSSSTALAIPVAAAPVAPRSVQYFVAHLDDARQIVAGCRDGSVRGDECANADQAVVTADSREQTARFLGKRP
jgi:hypothetical protein